MDTFEIDPILDESKKSSKVIIEKNGYGAISLSTDRYYYIV